MKNTITLCLLLLSLFSLPSSVHANDTSLDFINSRQYEGNYIATQTGPTFDYLDGKTGRLIAIFYGQPNHEIINSVSLFVLDPRYQDSKLGIVELKQILDMNGNSEWSNSSHQITLTTAYKQRQQDEYQLQNVSTTIRFSNLNIQDYQTVEIDLAMKGVNFQLTAHLTYYNQLVSTLAYCLYLTALVCVQIYSGWVLVRVMEGPNLVFTGKVSLLTLSVCNIQDFAQTMNHIQYIMGTSSGYLLFVLPALSYVVLFIVLDMKMLFLVWRSNNLRNMDNPQLIRKQLTTFYIQFYLGLFAYLTLSYFFSNDEWMIIIRNLTLLPQIIHNIRLGNNPGFNFHYIFGYIGTRLLLPIYQRLCPSNRFSLTPNVPIVIVLISLYVLQVVLLFLQSHLGSRFFVPKRFQPNYFNYNMKIKRDDSTMQLQCSICLQNLFEQPPKETHSINLTASDVTLEQPLRKEVCVMNTPCKHKFHQQCLKQWMEVKLECPSCRAVLPPA